MTCRWTLAGILLLLGAGEIGAQAIHGVVRDGTTRETLSLATVHAVNQRGSTVGTALTDSNGNFSLRLVIRASVRLRVERIGYEIFESDIITLQGAEALVLEVRLLPQPVELEEVSAVARSQNRSRDQFEQRRRNEISGQFLGPERLADYRIPRASNLLAQLFPRVTALPNGSIQVRSRGISSDGRRTCPPDIHVDGVRIPPSSPLDIYVSGNAIRGIEFYPDAIHSPHLLSRVPVFDSGRETPRISSPCVVFVIWTDRQFGDERRPPDTDG